MNKKIFSIYIVFPIVFLLLFSLVASASAKEYTSEFPNYLPYSGGAYIEVQSTLGKASLIVQSGYKDGYFGFGGDGNTLYNLSDLPISGRLVLSDGTTYFLKYDPWSAATYAGDPAAEQWVELSITEIYNTNIRLIDEAGKDRQNDAFTLTEFQTIVVGFLGMQFIAVLLVMVYYIFHRRMKF